MNLNLVNRMKKTIKKVVATATAPAAPAAPIVAKTPVKVAPAKTAAKATPVQKPIIAVTTPITIEAKIDVGFGNRLFLRGQGEGLSWDRGTPLECVDSQTWRLIVPSKDKLQFKLLINDSVWAKGEDVVATPGKRVELVPAF
jgi:hypothetical protein